MSLEVWIYDPDSELWFEWNQSHTVNVHRLPIDPSHYCYEFGDYNSTPTFEEFKQTVLDHLEEE